MFDDERAGYEWARLHDPDVPDLELEDIAEQAKIVGKLTPREFARLVGIAPQQVYYHIRQGNIEVEYCQCGRKVVDVAAAQEVINKRKRKGIVDASADREPNS